MSRHSSLSIIAMTAVMVLTAGCSLIGGDSDEATDAPQAEASPSVESPCGELQVFDTNGFCIYDDGESPVTRESMGYTRWFEPGTDYFWDTYTLQIAEVKDGIIVGPMATNIFGGVGIALTCTAFDATVMSEVGYWQIVRGDVFDGNPSIDPAAYDFADLVFEADDRMERVVFYYDTVHALYGENIPDELMGDGSGTFVAEEMIFNAYGQSGWCAEPVFIFEPVLTPWERLVQQLDDTYTA